MVAALPLVRALHREPGRRFLTRVADWAIHAWLFSAFLVGYSLLAEPRILVVLGARWRQALLPGVLLSGAFALWASAGDVYTRFPGEWGTAAYLGFWLALGLLSWCWPAVAVGVALRHLTRETPFLRWARPLFYPFYIFHQTVVVVVAYAMVTWPVGVHLRFLLIAAISLVAILLAMEVTRRVPGLRLLVGLDPPRRA